QRMVAVATGMQQLQADLAAFLVHRLRYHAMAEGIGHVDHAAGKRIEPATAVRVEAAGNDQGNTALGALGKIGGQLLAVPQAVFQAGVHRAHDDTVTQDGKAEIKRGKQVRVRGRHKALLGRITGNASAARHIWTASRYARILTLSSYP